MHPDSLSFTNFTAFHSGWRVQLVQSTEQFSRHTSQNEILQNSGLTNQVAFRGRLIAFRGGEANLGFRFQGSRRAALIVRVRGVLDVEVNLSQDNVQAIRRHDFLKRSRLSRSRVGDSQGGVGSDLLFCPLKRHVYAHRCQHRRTIAHTVVRHVQTTKC